MIAQAGTDLLGPLLQYGGPVGLAIIVMFGFLKEWIVPGAAYRRALRDRDEWKELALTAAGTAAGTVEVAKTAVRRVR